MFYFYLSVKIYRSIVSKDFTKQVAAAEWLRLNTSDNNTDIINRLKALDISSVDIAILFAGTNNSTSQDALGDMNSTEINTVCGGLRHTITSLLQANPKIKIFIFTPVPRYYGDDWSAWDDSEFSDNKEIKGNYYIKLPEICQSIIEVAKFWHLPVCDMYYTIGWNKYNWPEYFNATNDGTHPNKGFKNIAEKMFSFILSHKNL